MELTERAILTPDEVFVGRDGTAEGEDFISVVMLTQYTHSSFKARLPFKSLRICKSLDVLVNEQCFALGAFDLVPDLVVEITGNALG